MHRPIDLRNFYYYLLLVTTSLTSVSLFASAGIGDLALRAHGVDLLVANEILPERCELFCRNFPHSTLIEGDIWRRKQDIVDATLNKLAGRQLDILLATPPCQGMSKNGKGKLLNGARARGEVHSDPRNELIKPTVDICKKLQPRALIMENVPQMENTLIPDESGGSIGILEYIGRELGPDYHGMWEVVEFADYGVPQRRQRLITIFTRDAGAIELAHRTGRLLAHPSHSQRANDRSKKWVSIRDVISHLPPLDAGSTDTAKSDVQFHEVSLLDEAKYFWVSNTPKGGGAFDNQCVNPSCRFDRNPSHAAIKNVEGINRASEVTPIVCIKCGHFLPRPWVERNGGKRLMKGFTSAYKRMSWDLPASTLTTNFAYACSDNKIHPEQHRTLSTLEALMLHTVTEYDYYWEKRPGKPVARGVLRDAIGESVPPKGLQVVLQELVAVLGNKKHTPLRSAAPYL